MLVRRIARPLLSTIFIAGGIDALKNPSGKAQAAAPLIDKSTEALPSSVTDTVPTDVETLVKINAAVQIGGGVLLATGKAPRFASLALAGSLVPTTLAGHDFWNENDPAQRSAQRIAFLKNVSLLGGLLIASVDTEGKPSLGWRGRRAARNAQASLAGAIPLASSNDDHRAEHAFAAVSDRARTLGEEAAERGSGLFDTARERGSELAKTALDKGGDFIDVAKDRAPDIAEAAKERSSDWASLAADKSSDWASTAAEQSEVLGKRARKRGKELNKRSEKLGKKARKRSEELSKRSEKLGKTAREQTEAAIEKARAERAKLVK
ncbi:DoxX family membrane protein [Rhodococcus sp. NPDC058521]|uniref:DoxX family protein n=1 Tax=Rhodococcus sp. NPDC058521 TaxID=3346536 RepID=UPI00364F43A1